MRRAVKINFKDGSSTLLELSKATSIRSDVGMLHLDRMQDGKWRLIFSEGLVNDFSKIDSLDIVRED